MPILEILSSSTLLGSQVAATSAIAYAAWTIVRGLYNISLHPLAKYPGPTWAAFSIWWKINLEIFQGKSLVEELFKLHAVYGDVVRIGPNELHFSKPTAYNEIYNPRNRWNRDPSLYHVFSETESLLTMMDYTTAKKRKDILLPLFSRQSILNLQYLIQETADKMCANILKQAKEGKSFDAFHAFRCFALDGIASFCFGTSMKATEAPDFMAPVDIAMHESMPVVPTLRYFPTLKTIVTYTPDKVVSTLEPKFQGLMDMREVLRRRVQEVVEHPEVLRDAPHPTIFHELLNKEHGHKIPSFTSLRDEALLMVFAGTDTSSNTLTLGIIHILHDAHVHQQLKAELLETWPDLEDRPSYEELESLPYLKAVLKESLRMSNGVISPMTRIVPNEGAQISGRFIPGGTIVGVSNCFVHEDPEIFPEPHVFNPGRWLETRSKDEKPLDYWLVAFSKGPRSCLGQNLGWCKLILGLANVFRRFDLELDGVSPSDLRWQECYTPNYEGPKLQVRATPRTS